MFEIIFNAKLTKWEQAQIALAYLQKGELELSNPSTPGEWQMVAVLRQLSNLPVKWARELALSEILDIQNEFC